MSKITVKAPIPTKDPDAMIKLSEDLVAKHESFGGSGSPLDGENIADFKTDTASAKALLVSSREKHGTAEGDMLQAHTMIGIAPGQNIRTHNTLYFAVDVIRGILLSKLKDDEEQLTQYGFNVVFGRNKGKATVKVEIKPTRVDDFLVLCKAITKKFESFGGSTSPLDVVDMAGFKTLTNNAIAKHESARSLHHVAQGETMRAYMAIGIHKEQTSRTKGTLFYRLDVYRGLLLKKYKGDEEQLEQWGFTVVITEVIPHFAGKRVTVVIPKNGHFTVHDVINHSPINNIGVTDLEWCAGEAVCPPESTNVLNPTEEAEIVAPLGSVTIKNRSLKKAGRVRMTITN